jgi:hypothetical protein
MANEVVWYDSAETGAPTLNNAAGSLDAVLYACLVTGFRVLTLDSITVTSEVATATYAAGHGYSDKRVLELAGAATGAINGRKLITVTGASTFTFPAPGVSDGAISGTITAKRAPLGWTRPLTSGNVSIYERTDVTATGMKLRVDDSGSGAASATAARWRMIETYTDLSTFTGPTPPASAFSGAGVYIPKGTDSTTAKHWVLVGDGRTFYLFTEASSYPATSYSGTPQGIFAFGDIEPFRTGDPYACVLAGAESALSGANSSCLGVISNPSSANNASQVMLARPYHGIGAPAFSNLCGLGSSRRVGGLSGLPAYPSPVDNGMVISRPLFMTENNSTFSNPLRGQARGMGDPLGAIPGGLLHLQVLDSVVGSDRRWLLVGFNQQGSYGHAAFDLTGPW